MRAVLFIGGALFGFLLSRARITDYDTMVRFFWFEDFHVLGVMGAAIAVAALGLAWLRKSGTRALLGCQIELGAKPMKPALWLAGPLFGIGWGLTGT